MLSLFALVGVVIFGFISFVLFFYVAYPLKRMSAYAQKGRPTFFYPILGYIKLMINDVKNKGDFMAGPKEFGLYNSEKKVLVSNSLSNAVVLLRDSAYIKEYVQKQQYYNKGNFAKVMLPLLGPGLLLAEGEVWKRHRKIISNSFHYEFLKTNIPVIRETTRSFPQQNYHR